jgi:hypothetical protein
VGDLDRKERGEEASDERGDEGAESLTASIVAGGAL